MFIKSCLKNAIIKTIKEFFQQTTVHGYKYVVEKNRHIIERLSWFIVNLLAFLLLFYIALDSLNSVNISPTITSLKSRSRHISRVPFPAVCICNINKISLIAATKYAKELAIKDESLNETWILEQLRSFERLFNFNDEHYYEIQKFQDLLDRLDSVKNYSSGFYDLQTRMNELSPKCQDLLIKCQWGGRNVDCIRLFSLRLTLEGYCCTFNYIRPKNTLSHKDLPNPIRSHRTGADYGLVVLLNSTTSDYFVQSRNSLGFIISINTPTDYPDESTGNSNQIILPSQTEAFVKLVVSTVEASQEVEQFSIEQRGCLFRHELNWEYGGFYSFNDCLVKCKIKNFIELCGCIPFNLPINYPDFSNDIKTYLRCNLSHLKCLNRYKIKMNTIRPMLNDGIGVEKEFGDSLNCPDCLPLCSQSIYSIQTTNSRLLTRNLKDQPYGLLQNLSTLRDISILRVYYSAVDTKLYKTESQYTWEEHVGNFGGLLGICIGCSIVGLMEIMYFLTIRLYQNFLYYRRQSIEIATLKVKSYKNVEKILAKQMILNLKLKQ